MSPYEEQIALVNNMRNQRQTLTPQDLTKEKLRIQKLVDESTTNKNAKPHSDPVSDSILRSSYGI